MGEVLDLDGNVVRTEEKTFNVGTNMMTKPSLQIMSIRQMGKGKYGVRVNFSDFIKSKSFDYYYTMDEPWDNENYHLEGDFSLDLLINGVQVKWIDLTLLPYVT